jgi:hypothetical protein
VTKVIVIFFFTTTKPQKKTMVHCRHLLRRNKTKTKEGDDSFIVVTFFVATKAKREGDNSFDS